MKTIQMELPGGRLLTALQYGPERPYGIVFFHGTGYSGVAWQSDEQQVIRRGFPMIVPQRPGIGGSDPLPDFSVAQIIEDTKLLLESIDIQSVYLLAYATGSAYAASFARQYPLMTKGLGLINPALPLTPSSALPARWSRLRIMMQYAPFLLRWRIKRESRLINHNLEAFIERMIRHYSIADKMLFEQLHFRVALMDDIKQLYCQGSAGVWHDLQALHHFNWDIRGIEAPIDIWQGKTDSIWSVDTALVLKEMNPSARLWILANAGTWIDINEKPEGLRDLFETGFTGINSPPNTDQLI